MYDNTAWPIALTLLPCIHHTTLLVSGTDWRQRPPLQTHTKLVRKTQPHPHVMTLGCTGGTGGPF